MDKTTLETMLARGQDNALLRFTLGNILYQEQDYAQAEAHLTRAVELNPEYSAAWKIYGRTLAAAGKRDAAADAFRQGIAVATQRGDIQAAKEMNIFLRRVQQGSGA